MKYHPDRATDPKDKEAAKKKFQEISQAYHVLRDRK
jgi:DnaJ-class molecular chaperone